MSVAALGIVALTVLCSLLVIDRVCERVADRRADARAARRTSS